ncbi:hypothetical protein F5Y19DRAFT_284037 [Xylariaceae sp. FL1651]|nr:hypothetical protein F5Y19DRAFT_284037 [Xylariaceae sp. FL1651]
MVTSIHPQSSASKSWDSTQLKRKHADASSSTEYTAPSNKRQCLNRSLSLLSRDDTKTLNTVDTRYDVQLQSVISSSKIQQRVSAMLRHLAPPPLNPLPKIPAHDSGSSVTSTTAPKTSISILRAKAPETGKLITIAEIAKREIEKEQSRDDSGEGEAGQVSTTGRWFQYIALGEEVQQRRRDEGNTIVEDTVLGGQGVDENETSDGDDFEIMKTPFERATEGRPLKRGVPVMSLFLSRSSIEELKRRYGEQTNGPSHTKTKA